MEGIFVRLEEFYSLTVVRRSNASEILEENIPFPKAKMMETCSIHAQVDLKSTCFRPSETPGSPPGSAEVAGSPGSPSSGTDAGHPDGGGALVAQDPGCQEGDAPNPQLPPVSMSSETLQPGT